MTPERPEIEANEAHVGSHAAAAATAGVGGGAGGGGGGGGGGGDVAVVAVVPPPPSAGTIVGGCGASAPAASAPGPYRGVRARTNDGDQPMETLPHGHGHDDDDCGGAVAATGGETPSDHRGSSTWKRLVPHELREGMISGMFEELRRITGKDDERHLRMCAARYESLVWKRSGNQMEYVQKLERRIQSLRRQPSQHELVASAPGPTTTAAVPDTSAVVVAPSSVHPRSSRSRSSSSGKRTKHRHRSSSSGASSLTVAAREEQYFTRLRSMKTKYRDEVALVFRELCRVNTVIQNSASLRRHESNNLGDFLANLKKIIYLLEQQPDEMHGMIPQRKRTLEYLDVVESHIQRKVLPILYRLRHTYSTILRPLVLSYLRNCTRVSRRL